MKSGAIRDSEACNSSSPGAAALVFLGLALVLTLVLGLALALSFASDLVSSWASILDSDLGGSSSLVTRTRAGRAWVVWGWCQGMIDATDSSAIGAAPFGRVPARPRGSESPL